ncbi:SseB family protein [Nesterenkonia sp. F]|uniref:SseB family protein n=1 Tax=Nesterenkonia sp. F TaxID=795955 RepID=UPI000255CB3B|nr:SseB family protein [Nesterenkonia sp. F]
MSPPAEQPPQSSEALQSEALRSEAPEPADASGTRELPAHIAQLLRREGRDAQGRAVDSAGVSWEGRDLSGEGNPLHTFDGDDGLAEQTVAAARERLIAGEIDEAAFVSALRGARLFVPVLATASVMEEASPAAGSAGDKEAEISLVSLTAADGRRALPAFSSVETLTAWHPEARPVAAEAERVMLAALSEEDELVVLDPQAELTFVLRRPAVTALAQGLGWTPSYRDPELVAALEEVVEQCPGVGRLVVRPGGGVGTRTSSGIAVAGGGSGPELAIVVELESGVDGVDARLALASVRASLAELEPLRLRADSVEVLRAG